METRSSVSLKEEQGNEVVTGRKCWVQNACLHDDQNNPVESKTCSSRTSAGSGNGEQ